MATEIGTMKAVLELHTQGFHQGVMQAKKAIGGLKGAFTGMKGVAMGLAAVITGVVVAALAGLALAAKKTFDVMRAGLDAFADFDDAVRQAVASTEDQARSYRLVANAAQEMAAKWGVAQEEIASGMGELIKAGFEVEDSIRQAGLAMEFAKANGIEYAVAIDQSTRVMKIFPKAGKDLAGALNDITVAVDASTANFEEFSDSFAFIPTAIEEAGTSLQWINGVLAVSADRGVEGSRAGRALRDILFSLQGPSAELADKFKELNIELRDANTGAMRPMHEIMGDLADSTARADEIAQMFGNQSGQLVGILMQEKEAIDQLVMSQRTNQDAMERKVSYIEGSYKTTIEGLKKEIHNLKIGIGQELAPVITDIIGVFGSWAKQNVGTANTTLAMRSVTLDLLEVLASLIAAVGGVINAFVKMGAAIISVVKAAGAGIKNSVQGWSKMFEALGQAKSGHFIKAAKAARSAMGEFIDVFNPAEYRREFKSTFDPMSDFGERVQSGAAKLSASIKSSVGKQRAALKEEIQEWEEVTQNMALVDDLRAKGYSQAQAEIQAFYSTLNDEQRKNFKKYKQDLEETQGVVLRDLNTKQARASILQFKDNFIDSKNAAQNYGKVLQDTKKHVDNLAESSKEAENSQRGLTTEQKKANQNTQQMINNIQKQGDAERRLQKIRTQLDDKSLTSEKRAALIAERDQLQVRRDMLSAQRQLASAEESGNETAIAGAKDRIKTLKEQSQLLPTINEAMEEGRQLTVRQIQALETKGALRAEERRLAEEAVRAEADGNIVRKKEIQIQQKLLNVQKDIARTQDELSGAEDPQKRRALQQDLQHHKERQKSIERTRDIELDAARQRAAQQRAANSRKAAKAAEDEAQHSEQAAVAAMNRIEIERKLRDVQREKKMLQEDAHVDRAHLENLEEELQIRLKIKRLQEQMTQTADADRLMGLQREIGELKRQLQEIEQVQAFNLQAAQVRELEDAIKDINASIKHELSVAKTWAKAITTGLQGDASQQEWLMGRTGMTKAGIDRLAALKKQTAEREKQIALAEIDAKLATQEITARQAEAEEALVLAEYENKIMGIMRDRLDMLKQMRHGRIDEAAATVKMLNSLKRTTLQGQAGDVQHRQAESGLSLSNIAELANIREQIALEERRQQIREVNVQLAKKEITEEQAKIAKLEIQEQYMQRQTQIRRDSNQQLREMNEELDRGAEQEFNAKMATHILQMKNDATELRQEAEKLSDAFGENLSKNVIQQIELNEIHAERLRYQQDIARIEQEIANDTDGLISQEQEMAMLKEAQLEHENNIYGIKQKTKSLNNELLKQQKKDSRFKEDEAIALALVAGHEELVEHMKVERDLAELRNQLEEEQITLLEYEERKLQRIEEHHRNLVELAKERVQWISQLGSITTNMGTIFGEDTKLGGIFGQLGDVISETGSAASELAGAVQGFKNTGFNMGNLAGFVGGIAPIIGGIRNARQQGGIMGGVQGALTGAGAGFAIGGPIGGIIGGLAGGIFSLFGGGDYDIGEQGLQQIVQQAQQVGQQAAQAGVDAMARRMEVTIRNMQERGPGMDLDEQRRYERIIQGAADTIQVRLEEEGRRQAHSLVELRRSYGDLLTESMENDLNEVIKLLRAGDFQSMDQAKQIAEAAQEGLRRELMAMLNGIISAVSSASGTLDDPIMEARGAVLQALANTFGDSPERLARFAEMADDLAGDAFEIIKAQITDIHRNQLNVAAVNEGRVSQEVRDTLLKSLSKVYALHREGDTAGAIQLFNQLKSIIDDVLEVEEEQDIGRTLSSDASLPPEEHARIFAEEFFKRLRTTDRQVVINLDAKGALLGDAAAQKQLTNLLRDAIKSELGGGLF